MIAKTSVPAITMKQGRFKCLDRKQAVDALNEALLLGIPIDYERNFKGEYFTFISNVGVDKLREKHQWSAPKPKPIYRHKPKGEKRTKFLGLVTINPK